MNKKILISLGASALLASTLLASPNYNNMQEKDRSSCKQHKMMKKGKRGHDIMKMFRHLDLSSEQKSQIKTIVKNARKGMVKPDSAFTDTSFDKAKFIALSKAKREARIEHKAQMIEDMYKVLNASQKKDLKTMLDMREIMKKGDKPEGR